MRKKQRRDLHNWNFYQLEQFITYKAQAKGIKVEYVDSRYTSQKCSRCGYISRSNRQFQSIFKCKQCGFSLNADLNAARNIRQNYLDAICYPGKAVVNQPIKETFASNRTQGKKVSLNRRLLLKEESYKPSTLVVGS
jgi:putative transposase